MSFLDGRNTVPGGKGRGSDSSGGYVYPALRYLFLAFQEAISHIFIEDPRPQDEGNAGGERNELALKRKTEWTYCEGKGAPNQGHGEVL